MATMSRQTAVKARSRLGYIVHEREYELSHFPSIADMVEKDWCGPENEE